MSLRGQALRDFGGRHAHQRVVVGEQLGGDGPREKVRSSIWQTGVTSTALPVRNTSLASPFRRA